MTRITLSITAAACLGMAGAAFANNEPASFSSLDTNSDGMLTRAEVPADHKLAQDFATADSNGDGNLSQAEYDAWTSMKREDADEY